MLQSLSKAVHTLQFIASKHDLQTPPWPGTIHQLLQYLHLRVSVGNAGK